MEKIERLGYTTYGDIRGGCDHLHATREAAERCLTADQRACAAERGYSDRGVAVVGDDDYLYRDDDCTDWIPGEGGRSCGAARFVRPRPR